MQTTMKRRITQLEAQRRAQVDALARVYFDAVELALGADYDRWLDLAAGGIPAIRPAYAEWRGYQARIEADPPAKRAMLALIALEPSAWITDEQIEVYDAQNS